MDRKLFGIFSGWHITAMICAAVVAPSVIYAVPSFTDVAIINPNTGNTATVDSQGLLSTHDPVADPVAGYARDPRNFVHFLSPPITHTSPSLTRCPPERH